MQFFDGDEGSKKPSVSSLWIIIKVIRRMSGIHERKNQTTKQLTDFLFPSQESHKVFVTGYFGYKRSCFIPRRTLGQ